MSQPRIKCRSCNGEGHRQLPKALRKSFALIEGYVASGNAIRVSEFAKVSRLELTAAHHHIKRMVGLGVLKKVPKSAPARYVTV